jgi:AcrR family transcriptional regulator
LATGTRRMTADARKRQIVRVTLRTIGKHGVQGASITRIAKGAGITTAALYTHFENRQAILLAALDAVYEQVLETHRVSPDADAIERMREICQNYEELVTTQGASGHAHLFMEFVAAAPDRVLRDAVLKKESAVAAKWAQLVEDGKREGTIAKDVDPDEVALRIAAWAWSGNVALLMGHRAAWHPRLSSQLLEQILRDISTDSRQSP